MKLHHLMRWVGFILAAFFAFAGATCLLVLLLAPALADHCGVTILSPILAAVCFILSLLLGVLDPETCQLFRSRHDSEFDRLFPPKS